MKPIIVIACLIITIGLGLASANATETQVWVSNSGKDTGACLKTEPCATLRYAYGQVPATGAINIADSGSYGPIVIAKPLSIIAADGVDALIGVAPNSVGILVETTGFVLLKGLHIAGTEIDNNFGIQNSSSLGHVVVEHVTVSNVIFGVYVPHGFVMIHNSLLVGNGTGAVCNRDAYSGDCSTYVGLTTISGNTYGLAGQFGSYGDNDMNGNTTCDVCEATIIEVSHDQ